MMEFLLGAALGSVVSAVITWKVMAAKLRSEKEEHGWTRLRLTEASGTVSDLAGRVNRMINNPEIAVKASERLKDIKAKSRFGKGSKQ